jgi:hypothetical protein
MEFFEAGKMVGSNIIPYLIGFGISYYFFKNKKNKQIKQIKQNK